MHAVTLWRHYIDGSETIVYTDHKALLELQTQKELNQRQVRWMGKLQSFDLKFIHMPGRLNIVADALSRRPDYALNHIACSITADPAYMQEFIAAYSEDQHFSAIIADLQQPQPPPRVRNYKLEDGLLYLWDGAHLRLCVPSAGLHRLRLLQEAHDAATAAHRGRDATYEKLVRSFYWPKMLSSVSKFVASCDLCQRVKPRNRSLSGLLHPLEVPLSPWEVVSIDFITHLPRTKNGFDAIWTFVDKLTKRVRLLPTTDTASTADCARLYFQYIFPLHGLPKQFVSDRDTKFTSDLWTELFKLLGTQLKFSTAHHPQTDGQTERVHRILEEALRTCVNFDQSDWDEHLPLIEFAYNDSVHTATGYTPFFLDTGRHPRAPREVLSEVSVASTAARFSMLSSVRESGPTQVLPTVVTGKNDDRTASELSMQNSAPTNAAIPNKPPAATPNTPPLRAPTLSGSTQTRVESTANAPSKANVEKSAHTQMRPTSKRLIKAIKALAHT